jgi:hypothetical protein
MRRRTVRRIFIEVCIILGVILVVALVGWVGDILALRSARNMARESLEYFSEFEKTGCVKPDYYSDMKDGEAWDYYSRAVDAVQNVDKNRMGMIGRYLTEIDKPDWDTASALSILAECDSILSFMKAGTRQKKSTVPGEYSEGVTSLIVDFMAVRSVARLASLRARLTLNDDPESSVSDLTDGCVFSADIACGSPTALSDMIGITCLGNSRAEAQRVIESFRLSETELLHLAETMSKVSESWPDATRSLGGEWRLIAISLPALPLEELDYYLNNGPPSSMSGFVYWWTGHLRSWRYLFSHRRAYVALVNSLRTMSEDLSQAEPRGFAAVDSVTQYWLEKAERSRNWTLRSYALPFYLDLLGHSFEAVARLHVAGTMALAELYFLENGRWPDDLESLRRTGLEDLFVDPMTAGQLKYKVYPEGDSIAIYSVGTNLLDDGGLPDSKKGDLVFVLSRPSQ